MSDASIVPLAMITMFAISITRRVAASRGAWSSTEGRAVREYWSSTEGRAVREDGVMSADDGEGYLFKNAVKHAGSGKHRGDADDGR